MVNQDNEDRGVAIFSNAVQLNLFQELRNQLLKDFSRAGIAFPDLEKQDFTLFGASHFLRLLQERLYVLLHEDFNQFLSLMYAADIPEKSFSEYRNLDALDVAGHATVLLVEREWKKVCFRHGIHP